MTKRPLARSRLDDVAITEHTHGQWSDAGWSLAAA